jgi:carbamate kinase
VRIVAALGGNALLERGEKPDAEIQQRHVLRAVEALAPLLRAHDVIVTHGNGPQVGLLALESDADPELSRAYPLDVLGAQTQGMIGYWLAQAIHNAVPDRHAAAIVCQTVVDAGDRAFAHPSKFVGQIYAKEQAAHLARSRGWTVHQDGNSWRRVVPSPAPIEIVELAEIERLVEDDVTVVCAGGGGIPVVRDERGLRGIEAVVDKDRTAALLAELLGADALLLLTDVAAVEVDFGTPAARPLGETSVAQLRRLDLPDGSMGPKVAAVCDFVERTGHLAAIGRLEDAELLLLGSAGTVVRGGGGA